MGVFPNRAPNIPDMANPGTYLSVPGIVGRPHIVKRGSGGGNYTFQHAAFTSIDSANLDITSVIPLGTLALALFFLAGASGAANTLGIGIAVDGTVQQASQCSTASASNAGNYATIALLAGDGASHTFSPQGICSAAVNAILVNDSAVDAPLHTLFIFSML